MAFCIFCKGKLPMKRLLLIMITVMLLTGCGSAERQQAATETTAAETHAAPTEETAAVTEQVTVPVETEPAEECFLLTFVGDCTFGASPANYYAGVGFINTVGEDYGYPFRNVLTFFETDEATFANLEGPLTDSGNPVQKKHTFRGPTDYVNILTENSVEAVTLANNHSHDYGQTGYASTVKTLEEAGVPFADRDSSCVFTTQNGLKIGLYGAVYYQLDTESIVSAIASLKQTGCDLVIFAPHWGVEGTYRPTQAQVELAHAVIDAGADIVWGSHPHVLQKVERYGCGVIYYSLGNFSFGGNGYPRDYDTALIRQEVIRDAHGNITLGETLPVPASVSSEPNRNNYQPTPYAPEEAGYDRAMKKLNGTWDGPDLPIQ